jgi:Tfp pilus assembly protein FimV
VRKSLKTLVRPNRAHFTVPAALIGTLAATLVAPPAAAAPLATEREPRPHWRGVPANVVPASPPATTHVVAAGESVWSIASAHGLRPADVLAWNGLDWTSVIRPGQVL